VILVPEGAGFTISPILEVVATAFGRSFIKIKKRVGPNTEPWGIPYLTRLLLEENPLM